MFKLALTHCTWRTFHDEKCCFLLAFREQEMVWTYDSCVDEALKEEDDWPSSRRSSETSPAALMCNVCGQAERNIDPGESPASFL